MSTDKIVYGVVALIGVYMIAMNLGGSLLTPPVLSGVAFLLLGGKHFMDK